MLWDESRTFESIPSPAWLVVALALLATWAVVDRVLTPGVRRDPRRMVDETEDGMLVTRPAESGPLRSHANSTAHRVATVGGASGAGKPISQSISP